MLSPAQEKVGEVRDSEVRHLVLNMGDMHIWDFHSRKPGVWSYSIQDSEYRKIKFVRALLVLRSLNSVIDNDRQSGNALTGNPVYRVVIRLESTRHLPFRHCRPTVRTLELAEHLARLPV